MFLGPGAMALCTSVVSTMCVRACAWVCVRVCICARGGGLLPDPWGRQCCGRCGEGWRLGKGTAMAPGAGRGGTGVGWAGWGRGSDPGAELKRGLPPASPTPPPPGTPSPAISSLGHRLRPFRHLPCAQHCTKTHLTPSFSGAPSPRQLLPKICPKDTPAPQTSSQPSD